MQSVTFDINCTEWPCRAKVFTRSTTYAPLGIDNRNLNRISSIII